MLECELAKDCLNYETNNGWWCEHCTNNPRKECADYFADRNWTKIPTKN